MMNGWEMSGWGWGWMALMMLLGVVIVALITILLLRDTGLGRPQNRQSDAESILDQRLARGEIDEAEYLRLRQILANSKTR